jgi:hypothetical protein
MVRAVGSDPGTSSLDLLLLEGHRQRGAPSAMEKKTGN